MNMQQTIGSVVVLGLVGVLGCGESAPETAWTPTTRPAVDSVRVARADAAVKTLATRLTGALQESIGRDGPAAAIDVCSKLAPELAKSVGSESNLRIGRTSFRQRNTRNTPPEWAKSYVDSQHAGEVLLTHPDGTLAMLKPIPLAVNCVTCHGQPSQIPADVSARLQQFYPADRATGFNEGDLRGYFWVEVPADAR